MPRRPPTLVAQRAPQLERSRRSTTGWQKWYGSQTWRRTAKAFLALPENALCHPCKERGKLVSSAAVDHIIPHRGDEALFWSQSNWQAVCWPCHSSKTRREDTERRTGKPQYIKGCDERGWPLDPAHPWRGGGA